MVAALAVHNAIRKSRGQTAIPLDYSANEANPQRMWAADITRLWVNGSQRGSDGLIIRDVRTEITAADLLGA